MITNVTNLVVPESGQLRRANVATPVVDRSAKEQGDNSVTNAADKAHGRGPSPSELNNVVQNLNDFVQNIKRELHFSIDDNSGRTVITVINSSTDEVIRQIPPSEILELASALRDSIDDNSNVVGLLVKTEG